MELFRIETIARNNNLTILQGVRANNTRFSVYVSRYPTVENIIIPNYIFSNGVYYIVSISNGNDNALNNNVNNFYWENVNYNNNNFPINMHGISDTVFFYIKGLIF